MSGTKSIVVLGAGVIGLTTALKLQEAGYKVTVIAEILPTDPKSVKYTSQWAGAHHVSFTPREDTRRHALDKETFEVMWKMSAPGAEAEGCFLRLHQTEFFAHERPEPSPLAHMPEFRQLRKDELIEGALAGETFQTVTIDVPAYLNYLFSTFLARNGQIVRGTVQHLSQLAEGGVAPFHPPSATSPPLASTPSSPDAIVVCTGLGSLTLGGVVDTDMYPIRGQTLLLKAPHINFGRTFSDPAANTWTYIIPRRSGMVIIGGTLGASDDWYNGIRREVSEDIVKRVVRMCPPVVPAEVREKWKQEGEDVGVKDVMAMVVEEGCGFRPGRKGGVRLERGPDICGHGGRGAVPVFYNYGHAGAGYIASFGCARVVVDLVKDALKK